MVAIILALVLATASEQQCGAHGEAGPHRGVVTYWGESPDLSAVGFGDCTGTAWVGGIEVVR